MEKAIAMVLAGGHAKRMGMLCYPRPKPALPFAGAFRVIDFTLSNCFHSGVRNIAVLVDYQHVNMAEYLRRWLSSNGDAGSLSILHPETGHYAGTADAIFQNIEYLESQNGDTVIVLAGDHVYKMDYREMLLFHKEMKAEVTVGVVRIPIEQSHRFGTVTVDAGERIKRFVEKSSTPTGDIASMGIYVFKKDTLVKTLIEDAQEQGSVHDFGYSVLPRMVQRNRVFAYGFNEYWRDIGTIQAYYQANMELLGKRPLFTFDKSWPILTGSSIPPSYTSGEDNIVNSLMSSGCLIKGRVENSILSPGVYVDEKAIVSDSVVMANTFIGYHTVINSCILDEGINIGKFCYIGFETGSLKGEGDITVLGKGVTVPAYTAIGHNCKVLPYVGTDAFHGGLIPTGSTVVKSLP